MNLSIIITHYNKKEFLSNSIESVFFQLEEGDEIIVVDDCSSDLQSLKHVYEIKDKYAGKIKLIFNHKNQGASEAKNIGIRLASNEIIVLLDADDTLPEFAIANIRGVFNNDKSIDVLFGNYFRNEKGLNISEFINCNSLVKGTNSLDCKILTSKWLLLGTSPFKKKIFDKIGGFEKLYPRTDDRDFYIKAILNNAKFYYLDAPIYNWHRYEDGNNSNIPDEDSLSSYFRNIIFYYRFSSRIRFILVLLKNIFKLFLLKKNTNE